VPAATPVVARSSFTHVDPFEDTESIPAPHEGSNVGLVSPTSIRSRILKDTAPVEQGEHFSCFTHVDPFEDTERCQALAACVR